MTTETEAAAPEQPKTRVQITVEALRKLADDVESGKATDAAIIWAQRCESCTERHLGFTLFTGQERSQESGFWLIGALSYVAGQVRSIIHADEMAYQFGQVLLAREAAHADKH